ncbi:glucose-1-phosphate thymidylyltransferase [Spinactinospora alkalitolerans]|uniref:Glucose-1-phosphate thymidylyltransferase n=1 Tax=Spinactinospora alkalitolerans TaxID=687207 RepID=A0A852TU05_9ACTN|nr:sugar phosphate nucleotidyltransferase [Spinactinospora alkalitolerans]NYE45420.1 glucose-1-phosphate thymidylyltransferase [Spinactinospora alkalitolerans]
MKGILLAAGAGSRLGPLTATTSKHLLPVYDQPLVHYPLSVLMLAGIRDILLIGVPDQLPRFRALLGDGSRLGLRMAYAEQDEPRGIAEALVIGADFAGSEPVCLVLGDNLFHGPDLEAVLRREATRVDGCVLFGHRVPDPERFGVAVLDAHGALLDIREKPSVPPGDIAVTGLYMYSPEAVEYAGELSPSARGELEITDLNRRFVAEGRARLAGLGEDAVWLDAGTPDSLLDAGLFARTLREREGVRIGSPEDIARRLGYIGSGPARSTAGGLR